MLKRVLLPILLIALLSGCRNRAPTATDLLAQLLADGDTPVMEIYFDGAMTEEKGYLSEENERLLYGGRLPSALADEYAVALCKDDRIYEIHLYHALDSEKAEILEGCLQRRQMLLAEKENCFYEPDGFAASAVIWRRGKWVCLLVTGDNEAAGKTLRDALS